MEKLIRVAFVIVGAYSVISFMRWIFSITPGTLKYTHWGFHILGFNAVEALLVVIAIVAIIELLFKKD